MKKQITNESGITLIVLIITVVLMLILASIAITYTVGDNGVITKASQVSFLQGISDLQEELAEKEILARANGLSNTKIEEELNEILTTWYDENSKYEDIVLEIVSIDDDNDGVADEHVLTYVSGATSEQEEWLKSVNFPGVD